MLTSVDSYRTCDRGIDREKDSSCFGKRFKLDVTNLLPRNSAQPFITAQEFFLQFRVLDHTKVIEIVLVKQTSLFQPHEIL